jgi:signal transduction histidine kinase
MKSAMKMSEEKVGILLVDDQPQKLLAYQAILEPLDEDLICANSGREALKILLRQNFAAVLLDVVMPEMDGFETARMIRAHPRFRNTPIIFVTAISTSDIERLKGYELGAVDFVYVPVVPEILRAKVSVFADLYRKSQDLQALNRDLEKRVAERTSELQEALATLANHAAKLEREITERGRLEAELRLRAAQLSEDDRRKNEFLAMLAHELRNPLAPIRTAVDLLKIQNSLDPAIEKARDVIDRQLRQITRMVDDLLDLSRITRGQVQLRLERVELANVVACALETSRPLITARNHELTVAVAKQPIWLSGDAARLAQVLSNLINNAAKYTEPGGHIWVEADREEDEAVLRVRDTGSGIAPNLLPKIFDLFVQADRTLDRSQGGLGIGLTLVRHLVEMHGGRVKASSPGTEMGSEFVVYLPLSTNSRQVPQIP